MVGGQGIGRGKASVEEERKEARVLHEWMISNEQQAMRTSRVCFLLFPGEFSLYVTRTEIENNSLLKKNEINAMAQLLITQLRV